MCVTRNPARITACFPAQSAPGSRVLVADFGMRVDFRWTCLRGTRRWSTTRTSTSTRTPVTCSTNVKSKTCPRASRSAPPPPLPLALSFSPTLSLSLLLPRLLAPCPFLLTPLSCDGRKATDGLEREREWAGPDGADA
eukprot:2002127-Rhodomonas_salina.1